MKIKFSGRIACQTERDLRICSVKREANSIRDENSLEVFPAKGP